MMNLKKAIAGTLMAAPLTTGMPLVAYADGAASTRNIILGGALATYLIIQHNRKVHEKYAEDARNEAAANARADNASAAYASEKRAYEAQVAANADLKREVAYQHNVVVQQQKQLAASGISFVAPAQKPSVKARVASAARPQQVALVSYGWGQI